ncbi:hypothetical protein OG352_04050 [Streptomyces sp. NBC_01485]|uniref:hypothetical protein n=1 Tax=Streptomyces sp. NBC_01485 TaxID=2903884 RepID=UPI002E361BAF|nr:hypothetical protein [Streptomyces sp. NBC_01485]
MTLVVSTPSDLNAFFKALATGRLLPAQQWRQMRETVPYDDRAMRRLTRCQKQGQRVEVPPYVNDWWAYLPLYGGYITNIYVRSPDKQLPGVPLC